MMNQRNTLLICSLVVISARTSEWPLDFNGILTMSFWTFSWRARDTIMLYVIRNASLQNVGVFGSTETTSSLITNPKICNTALVLSRSTSR